MSSFNYLKEWTGEIGGLKVTQTAQPRGDGDELHVITGWHASFLAYFNAGSVIPFADADKLRDDAFRVELARSHMERRAKELREAADLTEKALSVPHGPEVLAFLAPDSQTMATMTMRSRWGRVVSTGVWHRWIPAAGVGVIGTSCGWQDPAGNGMTPADGDPPIGEKVCAGCLASDQPRAAPLPVAEKDRATPGKERET